MNIFSASEVCQLSWGGQAPTGGASLEVGVSICELVFYYVSDQANKRQRHVETLLMLRKSVCKGVQLMILCCFDDQLRQTCTQSLTRNRRSHFSRNFSISISDHHFKSWTFTLTLRLIAVACILLLPLSRRCLDKRDVVVSRLACLYYGEASDLVHDVKRKVDAECAETRAT